VRMQWNVVLGNVPCDAMCTFLHEFQACIRLKAMIEGGGQ